MKLIPEYRDSFDEHRCIISTWPDVGFLELTGKLVDLWVVDSTSRQCYV